VTSPVSNSDGPRGLSPGAGLLERLSDLVDGLRATGVPVGTTEVIDATEALRWLPLLDRQSLELGLGASLVKDESHWETFHGLFGIYFSSRPRAVLVGEDPTIQDGPATTDELTASELVDLAYQALLTGDDKLLSDLARAAVERFAGVRPDRPLGGNYYVFRALRHLEVEESLERLLVEAAELGGLEGLLLADEYRSRMGRLREQLGSEVRRRLVEGRGARAVAAAQRRPLPEDVDFMHLSKEELASLQRAIGPLARKLAVHLARQRRMRSGGRLDFRATMRRSLSTGGAPVEPQFRDRRRAKPELWVLADISGSVAAFARFTLQLLYALSSQFTRTRAWAFIDGVDEVTDLLKGADDMAQAMASVNTQADVTWTEGHSDYGHALEEFSERWGREVTPRTTVLVLGDARNNYHSVNAWALAELASRARGLWWLNPEPQTYWDTGDSVLSQYAPHCTGVYECRNLRQLRHFVEHFC